MYLGLKMRSFLSVIGLSSKSQPSTAIEAKAAAGDYSGSSSTKNHQSTRMTRLEFSSEVESLTNALNALQQSLLASQSNVCKQQEEILSLRQKHNEEISELAQLHREEILKLLSILLFC